MIVNYRKTFLYHIDEKWALEGPDGFFDGAIPGLGNVVMGICKWLIGLKSYDLARCPSHDGLYMIANILFCRHGPEVSPLGPSLGQSIDLELAHTGFRPLGMLGSSRITFYTKMRIL